MHPLGSRETADNIFYNRRDDRRNRIFQFTDHFRLTDERHLLYKQMNAAENAPQKPSPAGILRKRLIVLGIERIELAKMIGRTPPRATLIGRWLD